MGEHLKIRYGNGWRVSRLESSCYTLHEATSLQSLPAVPIYVELGLLPSS